FGSGNNPSSSELSEPSDDMSEPPPPRGRIWRRIRSRTESPSPAASQNISELGDNQPGSPEDPSTSSILVEPSTLWSRHAKRRRSGSQGPPTSSAIVHPEPSSSSLSSVSSPRKRPRVNLIVKPDHRARSRVGEHAAPSSSADTTLASDYSPTSENAGSPSGHG